MAPDQRRAGVVDEGGEAPCWAHLIEDGEIPDLGCAEHRDTKHGDRADDLGITETE